MGDHHGNETCIVNGDPRDRMRKCQSFPDIEGSIVLRNDVAESLDQSKVLARPID